MPLADLTVSALNVNEDYVQSFFTSLAACLEPEEGNFHLFCPRLLYSGGRPAAPSLLSMLT